MALNQHNGPGPIASIKRSWSSTSKNTNAEDDDDAIPWSSSPDIVKAPNPERPETATSAARKENAFASKALSSSSSSKVESVRGSTSENVSTITGSSGVKRTLPWETSAAALKQQRLLNDRALVVPRRDGARHVGGSGVKLVEDTRRSSPSASLTSNATNIQQKVILSPQQQKILAMVVNEQKSVFFTGSAGTGKSVLLREIIRTLKAKSKQDTVAVTASTGIAACNIGGVTLHSFAGIGLGTESVAQLLTKVKKNHKAASRWHRTKVLVIDEVSMVDGELFDKLESIARSIRKSTAPFGGIQASQNWLVVVTGDFFQLPPVSRGPVVKFCFEADCWQDVISHMVNLTQVFRQKDSEFVNMLNEMRFGKLSPQSIQKFKSLEREPSYEDGIEPTELYPRREEVDRANQNRMRALKGESRTFAALDSGTVPAEQRTRLLANMVAPQYLELKVDAQVMLIKNTDDTLVNGSVGKVVSFADERTYNAERGLVDAALEEGKAARLKKTDAPQPVYPIVRFLQPNGSHKEMLVRPETWKIEQPNGEIQASRTQLPLILAWAISIHKSQGQTLDRCRISLSRVFEKGQAYVALSRCTSLDGLQVFNFEASKVLAHPKVIKWSQSLSTLDE